MNENGRARLTRKQVNDLRKEIDALWLAFDKVSNEIAVLQKRLNGPATYAHPNKPRTVFCRRSELMRWTGWSWRDIKRLLQAGILKTKTLPGTVIPKFYVDSAQQILDDVSIINGPTKRRSKKTTAARRSR